MIGDFEKTYAHLDKLPYACALYRVELDSDGLPINIVYAYANQEYCNWTHKTKEELVGSSFFMVNNDDKEWVSICYKTAYLNEPQQFTRFAKDLNKWLNVYASQPEPGYCLFTCVDITNAKSNSNSDAMVKTDDVILKCAQILNTNSRTAIDEVLHEIGSFIKSDRVYIFEKDEITLNITYEWCNEGVAAAIDSCRNLPYIIMKKWEDRFTKNNVIFLEDIYDLQNTSPEEYKLFNLQGIDRLLVVPLYDDKKLIGLLGCDNYPKDDIFACLKIFKTLGLFLSSYLKRISLLDQFISLSYHDTLTNSLNRTAFSDYVHENANNFKNVGIIYIDINGLKMINDTHGHNQGDILICNMYEFLSDIFPSKNIFRMGGDEFIVLENEIDEETFLKQIEEVKAKDIQVPLLAFAMGAHYCKGKTSDIYRILKKADEKMYEDKKQFYVHTAIQNGRYRPRFDDTLGLTNSAIFHKLLAKGNFIFYLQPKINAKTMKVDSGEALLRLVKNNQEVKVAGDFIDLLESTHYINELDYFIFKKCLIQIKKWLDEGKTPIRVAINMSRNTISQNDFVEQILKIYSTCPVDKKYFEIEVTENAFSDNNNIVKERINSLHDEGFIMTMDDFGVDQSHISNIIGIHFDYIKIDRAITNTLSSKRNQMLVKGIIKICHDLEIKVVAEGIEDEQQEKLLLDMDIDELQGFYYSKAISIDDFNDKYIK